MRSFLILLALFWLFAERILILIQEYYQIQILRSKIHYKTKKRPQHKR